MMTLAIEHIVCDPGKHGGKPYITGTGMTVQYVATLHNCGWTVQDFTEEFEVTAGQVYAALSYYADHQQEIDHAIHDAADKVQHIGISMAAWKHQIDTRKASQ
jgi:uncharacterized protein (DUF433 family)